MVWYGVRGFYRGSAFHDNSIKENTFVLLIIRSHKKKKKQPNKKKLSLVTEKPECVLNTL